MHRFLMPPASPIMRRQKARSKLPGKRRARAALVESLEARVLLSVAPTDNPITSQYGADSYAWTNNIRWADVYDFTAYGGIADGDMDASTGSCNLAAFNALQDVVSAAGGGVIYFPAGTYLFSDNLYIKDGVVLRGETPMQLDAKLDDGDAATVDYDPPSNLVFPKYTFDATANGGLGNDYRTAFKSIYSENIYEEGMLVSAASNTGVVFLDINRAGLNLGGANVDGGNANVLIYGTRTNNVAKPRPVDVGYNWDTGTIANSWQQPWQMWEDRFMANIRASAFANLLVANNKLNDAVTDAFKMEGYMIQDNATPLTGDRAPTFNYTDHYGISLQSQGSVWYCTPETSPEVFRTGIEIRDNWVYNTKRVHIIGSGLGLIIRDNVGLDNWLKFATAAQDPTSPNYWSWIDPTGRKKSTGSNTNENRGIDVAGWDVLVEGNNMTVYTHRIGWSSGYATNDGEGILFDNVGSTCNGYTVINNTLTGPNVYIGIYRTTDINNVLFQGNTINKGGNAIWVWADPTNGVFNITNVQILDNIITGSGGKIIVTAGDGNSHDILISGNQLPGNIDFLAPGPEGSNNVIVGNIGTAATPGQIRHPYNQTTATIIDNINMVDTPFDNVKPIGWATVTPDLNSEGWTDATSVRVDVFSTDLDISTYGSGILEMYYEVKQISGPLGEPMNTTVISKKTVKQPKVPVDVLTANFTLNRQGVERVWVWGKDRAGVTGDKYVLDVGIDLAPPVINLIFEGAELIDGVWTWTEDQQVVVKYDVDDASAGGVYELVNQIGASLPLGLNTIELTVVDKVGNSTSTTVQFFVQDVEHAPVAMDDSYETDEDVVLYMPVPGVMVNDYDQDGDVMTLVVVDQAANGVVVANPDGSFEYTPNANYYGVDSFTYKLIDDTGLESNVATVSITVLAVNDAPVIDEVLVPSVAVRGQALLFEVAASDVDGDQLAVTWDFGDGNVAQGESVSHSYSATGEFEVTVTVDDGNGGVASQTFTITVDVANVQDGTLFVGGSDDADTIAVSASGDLINVHFANVLQGSYTGVTQGIVVYGNAGNDVITISSGIKLRGELYGGDGDDHLNLGSGGGVAVGGAGNDMLIGGGGRDLLIGGLGSDKLIGNAGEDILIAGLTAHDGDRAALNSILDTWNDLSLSFNDRIQVLRAGLLADDYLFDDAEDDEVESVYDMLNGGSGEDWFIVSSDGDKIVGQTDTVTVL